LICQIGNAGCLHRPGYREFILLAPASKQRLMRVAPASHQFLYGDVPRRSGVLRQQANAAGYLFAGVALDLFPVEKDAASQRRHQAAQGPQQGRFSAAVGADNGREMAIGNRDVQILRHGFFAVAESKVFAVQAGCCSTHFLRDS
jgi:hypothetical protein